MALMDEKWVLVETDLQEPPEERMGVEAFLAWCEEDVRAEWVEGKVMVMAPASLTHQEFVGFLGALLRIFAEDRQLGTVLSAPFPMRLGPELSVREPDLLFVVREHKGRLQETYLDGAADLVVEIVSSESRLRDRGAKFAEYEVAGVREYWLFDLERERVDFYRLDTDGRYRFSDPDAQGVYRALVVPGFWLRLGWVLQRPLPSVLEVLQEIGVTGGSRGK